MSIKLFIKSYNKISNIGKILIFVILFLIILSAMNRFTPTTLNMEGYETRTELIFKENDTIYDNFYASIYDQLVYNEIRDDYQVGMIMNKTSPSSESRILDIGSGTGQIVNKLNNMGYVNALGVDKSSAMIKKARDNFPTCDFMKGDVMHSSLFQYSSFTHIICLYFTFYYIKNKYTFLKNCYDWLMSGGHLVIHIVEPEMFDPIIPPGNPLLLVSPQRYAKERITTSKVVFNDFSYQSDFKLDGGTNNARFIEKFTDKNTNKKFRRNEHTLYFESIDTILQIAQEIGFIVSSKIDLVSVSYEYQFLYVFQKP